MDKLTIALAFVFAVSAAAFLGYLEGRSVGTKQLKAFQLKAEAIAEQAKAKYEKTLEQYKNIGGEYYELYQEALAREPDVIIERVRIPIAASCDSAESDPTGAVGTGAAGQTTAELPESTVAELRSFAQRAESELMQCRAALGSVISKVELHNESVQ